jgi:hypothetical protein
MVCQCGGTEKGIKSKVGGELDISLQALFTYLCDLCVFDCTISPLILLFFNKEMWTDTKPDVSHLRVFGCKTFAHSPDENRSKLESKSIPCVFLMYCEGTKAYRLMCLETKRIIKS